jgi:DNA-binding MarR family transcriptional regulator
VRNGVGIKIKKIQSLIRKSIHNSETFKTNEELTNVIGWTIGFISRRNLEGIETYQKDVEKEFDVTRSTASKVIELMEQKGLVRREKVSQDARLRKIVLTQKAEALSEMFESDRNLLEETLTDGFSE